MVGLPFPLYPPGCLECGKDRDLVLCECGAALYCQPAHKYRRQATHIECCRAITAARQRYEESMSHLSEKEVKLICPKSVLEMDFDFANERISDHFQEFLKARTKLAHALRSSYTRRALDESNDLMQWMSILEPFTYSPAPRVVASYLIRANRDDECHHFLRELTLSALRWRGLSTAGIASDHTRDPWNDADFLHNPLTSNMVLLFGTLIKIRMLVELRGLKKIHQAVTETIGSRLPLELLDRVRYYLHRNPILATMRSARYTNYEERMEVMTRQVYEMWWTVRRRCKLIWPYLLDDRVLLSLHCRGHNHDRGQNACTRCLVAETSKINIMDAWKQSPGAIDIISGLVDRYDQDCLPSDDQFYNWTTYA